MSVTNGSVFALRSKSRLRLECCLCRVSTGACSPSVIPVLSLASVASIELKPMEVGNVEPRFPDILDAQINDVPTKTFKKPVSGGN